MVPSPAIVASPWPQAARRARDGGVGGHASSVSAGCSCDAGRPWRSGGPAVDSRDVPAARRPRARPDRRPGGDHAGDLRRAERLGRRGELADLIVEALAGADHLEIVRDGDTVVARTDLGRDRRVVIAGHLDTVPINDNLPTRFETIDGEPFLWGRGTVVQHLCGT